MNKGKVIAIDSFNAYGHESSQEIYNEKSKDINLLRQFSKNMEQGKILSKIEIKKGYSQTFATEIKEIDLLFIDGDHSITGTKSDFMLYGNKIKKNGYILFYDYYIDRDDLGPKIRY